MKYTTIIYEKKDNIARITLNRPQALNAINPQLLEELQEALNDIAKDDTVGVVVLTGSGRAFSAGVDIKGMEDSGRGDIVSARKGLALNVIQSIENLNKPVIAAVKGYCLTGALELATACDLIVASENAVFGDTHARWGFTPTWGGSQRLPRIVGAMKAKEMVFTCDMLTAKEAQQIGLVNKVTAPEKLDETVHELASKILANSRASISIQKSLMNRGLRLDYASALKMAEAESPGITGDSESRLQSFKDKTWDKASAKQSEKSS
ncbi:enoyl-CoA hydratase/isomerase family protein [Chloroflexota bacterium]